MNNIVDAVAMDIFESYSQNKIPKKQGIVVSAFFDDVSFSCIYEIIMYFDVKEIFSEKNYYKKSLKEESPPKEAIKFTAKHKKIHITVANSIFLKKEIESTKEGCFWVLKPDGIDFAFLFYDNYKNSREQIRNFMVKTMNQEALVDLETAEKLALEIVGDLGVALSHNF